MQLVHKLCVCASWCVNNEREGVCFAGESRTLGLFTEEAEENNPPASPTYTDFSPRNTLAGWAESSFY